MFQKRNQTSRNADHLARRDVHVLDLLWRDEIKVTAISSDNISGHRFGADNSAIFQRRVGRGNIGFGFFIGPQQLDFVGDFAFSDHAIRRHQKAVVIHAGINRQAGNQADVGTFRRLNRANSTVVRNVHVANFKARTLPIQTARAQSRQTTFVRQLRKRIRLVDDLRQLSATKEIFDRCRNALGIDQAARSHVLQFFQLMRS